MSERRTHCVQHAELGHMPCVYCEVIPQLLSATPPGQSATNKVFHTRRMLTVHWLLCSSVIGSLSPPRRGKTREESEEIIQGQEALMVNHCHMLK